MKTLVILTLELPQPEAIAAVLAHIDPLNVPHFTGEVRVTPEPFASVIENWLDEE